MKRLLVWQLIVVFFGAVAITGTSAGAEREQAGPPDYVIAEFGYPPEAPTGPLTENLKAAIELAIVGGVTQAPWGQEHTDAIAVLVKAKDPRITWIMADALRYAWDRQRYEEISDAAAALLGIRFQTLDRWSELTDHLIAWDLPAYDSYLLHKRAIFVHFGPRWDRLFVEGDIDWRHVSWGGVEIDDRPYGETDRLCNCIPAVDNPEVVSASEATWITDDAVVFGITVNGEARAYPRRIMEVREMVNDTLGGRALGIPYCTLCGAAQAYFTDKLPGGVQRPVLRTSGLLIRSNKVMYDIVTHSVFDTFLGKAVTGPLAELGIELGQVSVVTTDWGTWKETYPDTTVLIEELALGRDYDFRNGRDAKGPIFPVGDVDPRLSVHEDIVGVITGSGQPVAFQRSVAIAALKSGVDVVFEDFRLILDAGGVRAVADDGTDRSSHQAFWFAWSQFHPATAVWFP